MKVFYYTNFFTQVRDWLIEKCTEVIKKEKKALYILPSREAIFDVRSKFLKSHGNLVNTYIVGFDGLEREIVGKKAISEDISLIILRNILSKRSDGFFKDVKDKAGFVTALYAFIKRLKRLNILPENLNDKCNFTGLLQDKLNFIQSVYEEYEAYKKKESLYALDDISLEAVKKVKHSFLLFQTGIIVIDGYINLDPINKSLLKSISEFYPKIDFYVSIPFKNLHNESLINNEIIKDLKDLGFICGKNVFPLSPVNPSIKSLCDNLYSDEPVLKGVIKGIKLLNSPCIDHEVRETAGIIKRKIMSGETVPEKIAIYVKNINEYSNSFKEIFEEMDIPVGYTWKKTLIEVPFVKDLLSLFNIYIKGREKEGIKNLFSSIYLLPFEILKKLDFKTDGLPLNMAFRGKDRSEYLSKLSSILKEDESLPDFSSFLEILSSFKPSDFKTKEECLEKLIDLIHKMDLKGNIINLYLEGITDTENFARDIKAFDSLENLLKEIIVIEKKYNLLSNELTIETIYEELIQWAGSEIRNIKNDTGGIKILNPDLARGQYYQIVFILGVNEGIFPSVTSGNSLFDLRENDFFMSRDINLINRKWELEREKIRFNLSMATATEELYISYRTCDERGEYMIKSSFIDDLFCLIDEDTLKSLAGEKIYMRKRFESPKNPSSGREAIRKVIHYIWKKEYSDKKESMEKIIQNVSTQSLDYINHAALMEYGRKENPLFDSYDGILKSPSSLENKYYFSPSQFNSYVLCPFKYFIERILAISVDEEEEEPDSRKIGSFYHEVLKNYYSNNNNILSYDEKRLKSIFSRIFDSTLKKLYENTMPEKLCDFIKKELFIIISNFIISDVKNLNYYYEKTGFTMKPYLLEHSFEIKDENKMIRGIVDRVDLEMDGKENFTGKFIIYDYKNSSVKGIRDCVEGKDFQLPVYYRGIKERLKDKFPDKTPECIALIYYSITKNKRNGIVRSDVKKDIFKRGGPDCTPGIRNMIVLMEHCSEKISDLIENIKNGTFILPYSCFFNETDKLSCSYKTICRYDKYRISEKEVKRNA